MASQRTPDQKAYIRPITACLVASLTPVCATLALGGADWVLGESMRVSWYGDWVAWPMLAAASGLLLWRPRRSGRLEILVSLGLIGLVAATLILWTGGTRLDFVSFRSPQRSAWTGLALIAMAALGGLQRVHQFRRASIWLAAALSAGLLVQASLMQLDGAYIATHIPLHGDSQATAGPLHERPLRDARQRPDVVWIVVDTLRADAIGAYRETQAERSGAAQGGTPGSWPEPARTTFLDGMAARGVVFERVMSTAPWTLPSMMSTFTSRWPSTLDPDGRGRARVVGDLIGLDPATPTWIRVFRDAGYHTAGFQKNPFLAPRSGFATDFDYYRFVRGDAAERESGSQLVSAVLRWANELARLREPVSRTPFLLYVHFMEPHIDYRAPSRWLSEAARAYDGPIDGRAENLHAATAGGRSIEAEDLAQLRRLYAAEVAYLDFQIGRLVVGLRERGLVDERTLWVVSSDHGEQFAEHGGWEHGGLHVENVHVPFMLTGAGLEPRRSNVEMSLLDLGPTILEAAGLPPLIGAEGRSRLGSPASDPSDAFGSEAPGGGVISEYGEQTRIAIGRWVLIDGPGEFVALFDRELDAAETVDRSRERPQVVRDLQRQLRSHSERGRRGAVSPKQDLAEQEIEALRALGYLR